MILIVGGHGAGKRAFALETLGCEPRRTIFALQDRDPLPTAEELMEYEAVLCDEVGCGVIPLDPGERERREAIGRLCCQLARRAKAVYRIQCGLAMRLK